MGFFGDSKKEAAAKAAKATGKAVAKSLAWPAVKIKDGAMKKYYQKKGNWNKDECPECGKPINKVGFIHRKCVKNMKDYVKALNTPYRDDGSSRSGVHFTNCSCNRNWAVHECSGKMGDPI